MYLQAIIGVKRSIRWCRINPIVLQESLTATRFVAGEDFFLALLYSIFIAHDTVIMMRARDTIFLDYCIVLLLKCHWLYYRNIIIIVVMQVVYSPHNSSYNT